MSLNNNNSSNSEPYNPPSPFSPSTQKISNVRRNKNNKTQISVTSPAQPKCQTCGSRNNCEEDIDNPGDYYCKVCWEEYSAAQQSGDSQESNSSSDEKSPAKIDGASTTKNPFAKDKNVENKQQDEGEGGDPLPSTLNPFDNVGTTLDFDDVSTAATNNKVKDGELGSQEGAPDNGELGLEPTKVALKEDVAEEAPPEEEKAAAAEGDNFSASTQPLLQTQALSEIGGGGAYNSSQQQSLTASEEALVTFATQADNLQQDDSDDSPVESGDGDNIPEKVNDKDIEKDEVDVAKGTAEKDNTVVNGGKATAEMEGMDVDKEAGKDGDELPEVEKDGNKMITDEHVKEVETEKTSGGETIKPPEDVDNGEIPTEEGPVKEKVVQRSLFSETTAAFNKDGNKSDDDDDIEGEDDGASIKTQEETTAENNSNSKGDSEMGGGGFGLLTQAVDEDDDVSDEEDDKSTSKGAATGVVEIVGKANNGGGEVNFAQDIIDAHKASTENHPMLETVATDSQHKHMTLSGLTEPTQPEHNVLPRDDNNKANSSVAKSPEKKSDTAFTHLADDDSAYHGLSEEEKDVEKDKDDTDNTPKEVGKDVADLSTTENSKEVAADENEEKKASSQQDGSSSPSKPEANESNQLDQDETVVEEHSTSNKEELEKNAVKPPVDAEMEEDDEEDDERVEGTGDTIVGTASEGWSLYGGDTQMLPTGPSQLVDAASSQLQNGDDIEVDKEGQEDKPKATSQQPAVAKPAVEKNADAELDDDETQPPLDEPVVDKPVDETVVEEKEVEGNDDGALQAMKHTPEDGSPPITYPDDDNADGNKSSMKDAAPKEKSPTKDAQKKDDAMEEDDDREETETQLYSQDLLAASPSPKRSSIIKKDDNDPTTKETTQQQPAAKKAKLPSRQTTDKEETNTWMSSTRHGNNKEDKEDNNSPRLLMPFSLSDKPTKKSPLLNNNKKQFAAEDDESSSDDESLSGNGHSYDKTDPIENTQDDEVDDNNEKKRPNFKRLARSSARDDSTLRKINQSTKSASRKKDKKIKPKILRYEPVTKTADDSSSTSAGDESESSSSEEEFSDDNIDNNANNNQYQLSQTDARIKKQLREIKAVLPSAEEIKELSSRKALSDEIVELKKSHKAAMKKLKSEKKQLSIQLKKAQDVIKQKEQVIEEKNGLLKEQFAVIERVKEMQIQGATSLTLDEPATKSKKRKKEELPSESESDSESEDDDEVPISALKSAPAASNKKRRKSYGGSRQEKKVPEKKVPEKKVEPKSKAKATASASRSDTSFVETSLVSNKSSAKSKKNGERATATKRSSAKVVNSDDNLVSSEVWKTLQEKGWTYKTGPEPYNKVYVPRDGAVHTGTKLGVHFFECDGVIAAARQRGDLPSGRSSESKASKAKATQSATKSKTPSTSTKGKETKTKLTQSAPKSARPSQSKKKSSEPAHKGYAVVEEDAPMDDSKLLGKSKSLTLESAQACINILANFMLENDHERFNGHFFQPLWTRLKDQGADVGLNWRYEKYSAALSSRNWAFVPPYSVLGVKGKLGKDYYLSEEQVALSVLKEVNTMKEVSHLLTKHKESFSVTLGVLTRAVDEDLDYKDAKNGVSGSKRTRKAKSSFQPGESESPVKESKPATTKRKSPQQKKAEKSTTKKKRRASKITPDTRMSSSTKKQKTTPKHEDDDEDDDGPSFHLSQTQGVDALTLPSYNNRRSPGNNNGPLSGFNFFYSGIDANFKIDEKIKQLGGRVANYTSLTIDNAQQRKSFFLADPNSWRKHKYLYAAALGVPMLHKDWITELDKKYKETGSAKAFDSDLYIKYRLPLGLDISKGYYPLQRATNARCYDAPGMKRGEGQRIFEGMTIALAVANQENDWKMILTACGATVKTLTDIQKGKGKIDVDCCLLMSTTLPPHVVSTPLEVSQLMQVIGEEVPLLDLAWAHQSIIQRKCLPLEGDDDDDYRYSVSLEHSTSSTCQVKSIKSAKGGARYEIGDLVQFSIGSKSTAYGRIIGITWARQGKCKLDIQLLETGGEQELVDCDMSAKMTVDESSLQGNVLMLGANDFVRLGYINGKKSNIFNRKVPSYESQM